VSEGESMCEHFVDSKSSEIIVLDNIQLIFFLHLKSSKSTVTVTLANTFSSFFHCPSLFHDHCEILDFSRLVAALSFMQTLMAYRKVLQAQIIENDCHFVTS